MLLLEKGEIYGVLDDVLVAAVEGVVYDALFRWDGMAFVGVEGE